MAKYTDDDIRSLRMITTKIAGQYLGIAPIAVAIGMRNGLLPIGFVLRDVDFNESWTYIIVPERLIDYNHGRINGMNIINIEASINALLTQFDDFKHDIGLLLNEQFKQCSKIDEI